VDPIERLLSVIIGCKYFVHGGVVAVSDTTCGVRECSDVFLTVDQVFVNVFVW